MLADLPALDADLVGRVLERQPDMVVVGRLATTDGLPELARQTAPDVIVLGLETPRLPPGCAALFDGNGRLMVLGLEGTRRLAHVYRLLPDHRDLGELGPAAIVGEIRTAVLGPHFS